MKKSYNPKIHHRRSIRLRGYDYSQAGFYFITICSQGHAHLFGEIVGADSISAPDSISTPDAATKQMDSLSVNYPKMMLNDAGKMVAQIWHKIPTDFHNARLHEFVIMPNHIHGIIEIVPVGADSISALDSISANRAEIDSAPTTNDPASSLSNMIQSFKRHTSIEYIKMVKQNIWPSFNKRIWQRNYWEHIIRNGNEYRKIAQYILENPAKWEFDKLNGGTGNQVMESRAEYDTEAWMV